MSGARTKLLAWESLLHWRNQLVSGFQLVKIWLAHLVIGVGNIWLRDRD